MVPLKTTCRVDTTNWNRAQELLLQFSKSEPAEAMAKAVAFVVDDAKRNTPFTALGRIDSELAVTMFPRVGARGQPLSTKQARNRLYNANRIASGGGLFPAVPLSWLLISARAKQTSNYNVSTSWKWMIGGGIHPLKGHKVSEFKGIFDERISRMVKARHSSTHYYQQSWNAILLVLSQLVPSSYMNTFLRKAGKRVNEELGDAVMSGRGTATPTLRIDNLLGMQAEGDALAEHRNAGAHRILAPALQGSIDRNYLKQTELLAKRGLAERAPAMKNLGFDVR